MEFSQETQTLLNEGLTLAREDGFLFVGAAYNENDGSIQFVNNDALSRMGCAKILEQALEALRDTTRKTSKEEIPTITIGEA